MPDDRRRIAALLLVLQSGLALVAALGLYTYARFTGATAMLAVPELEAFGGPALLLLFSAGIVKGWRIARIGVYTLEALIILGTAFSVLASAGAALTLSVGLTGFALPAAIVVLVRNPHGKLSPNALQNGLTVGLLLLTGLIHLALVPAHLAQPPRLGVLFALDGAAFLILAVASARQKAWWRGPTVALLLATILAYVLVVISGKEAVDDLGIATKLIELTALGLVLWPRDLRARWGWMVAAASLLATIVVSGGAAWAATLRPGAEGPGHTHDGKVLIAAAAPTDEQRAAVDKLVADTTAGIERYHDVHVALADGYVPTTPPRAPTVHYVNAAYVHDGRVLDPTRPEALVYGNTPNGPVLLGAMYMMPKANMAPPDVGGSLAEWHTHPNLCFTVPRLAIDGTESPFGTCPMGSINGPTPAMLHVWLRP